MVRSLYSAFNRKNFDELRALWLPDESVEMTLPGYEKAVRALLVLTAVCAVLWHACYCFLLPAFLLLSSYLI